MLGSELDFSEVMSDYIQASGHGVNLVSKVVNFSDDAGDGDFWVISHWISVGLHIFYSGVLGAFVVLCFFISDLGVIRLELGVLFAVTSDDLQPLLCQHILEWDWIFWVDACEVSVFLVSNGNRQRLYVCFDGVNIEFGG